MIALGLVLLVLAALVAVVAALSNGDPVSGVEAFGVSFDGITAGELFLLGVAVGAVAMLGAGLMVAGALRGRSRRRAARAEVDAEREQRESLAEHNARLRDELARRRDDTGSEPGVIDLTASDASAGQQLPEHGASPGADATGTLALPRDRWSATSRNNGADVGLGASDLPRAASEDSRTVADVSAAGAPVAATTLLDGPASDTVAASGDVEPDAGTPDAGTPADRTGDDEPSDGLTVVTPQRARHRAD